MIGKLQTYCKSYFDERNTCYFDLKDPDGYLCQLEVSGVEAKKVPLVSEICDPKCCYYEKVFSESGSITQWEHNDKTSILTKKIIAADTIQIDMIAPDGTKYTISDNTYGTYYSTFTAKPLYVGFIADWNLIYNSLGTGIYYFEITETIIGVTTKYTTINYHLSLYSERAANNTVRIETWNTGVILNSDFDYKDLLVDGWYQSYRIPGKLNTSVPKLTTDNYYNQAYELLQIQDKITDEYTLETHLLPYEISKVIIYDNLLANKILISDFNLFNETIMRSISLYPTDIQKKAFGYNSDCMFTIKFTTKFDDTIKNNF